MFPDSDDGRRLANFGRPLEPEEAIEPILSKGVRGALLDWLDEIWAEDELRKVGIAARKRALFSGPPGVGKTTLAHHLAARLGMPMLAVASEAVIDKYVGATEKNIGELFALTMKCNRAAAAALPPRAPVLLFFDEFDTLAAKRRSAASAADQGMNDQVNVLLRRVVARRNGGPAIWTPHLCVKPPALSSSTVNSGSKVWTAWIPTFKHCR